MIDKPKKISSPPKPTPPEGPHADPKLIDSEKTPGSGMFPKPGKGGQAPSG